MIQDPIITFLRELVQQRSLSGSEQGVCQRIAAQMNVLGYDRVFTDANGSVIGVIEGASSGATLLLDAHCDTVGITTPEAWTYAPFDATVEDGRMFGRGTADMKGALAAMVYAAAGINRDLIAGRVVVSATVMEEVMEGIALGTVMDEVHPDFVVIGEATDLNLNHGGRGRAEIQLEAIGKPAHSSNPAIGVNAVHEIIPAIQAIAALSLSSDPLLGDAIMTLTDIISDPYPGYSVIPARCRVTYDRRLLVGETINSVLSMLEATLGRVQARVVDGDHITYTGARLHSPKFFPAWKFPADHPFVQAAYTGLQDAGLKPHLTAYRFCTNAATSAGVRGVPTIGFGPSREEMAHVVDEYIEIDELLASARGYQCIIKRVLQPS